MTNNLSAGEIIELLTKEESTNLNKLIKDYNNKLNEFEVSFFG